MKHARKIASLLATNILTLFYMFVSDVCRRSSLKPVNEMEFDDGFSSDATKDLSYLC